ncbi:MAG: alpha-1,2-fucosyltransferase, partial [Alphaproteobacteria bacterium]
MKDIFIALSLALFCFIIGYCAIDIANDFALAHLEDESDLAKMNRYVETHPGAGLGNRMFQYAAAFGYAEKHGKKLFINDDNTLFELFEISAGKSSENPLLYSHIENSEELSSRILFTDSFDENMFANPFYISLMGYAQNPRFFNHVAKKIKREFRFKIPLAKKNQLIAKQMERENSICLHVRRGDYLTVYPTLTLSYYQEAVRYILTKDSEKPHLYVFSNDTPWLEKHFKLPYKVSIIPQNRGIEDMQLMTHCRHNVIANSSFSWWGAYLNPNPNKIVVLPDRWDYWHDTWAADIKPEKWHAIPAQDVKPYKIAVVTYVTAKTQSAFSAFKEAMDKSFFIYMPKMYFVLYDGTDSDGLKAEDVVLINLKNEKEFKKKSGDLKKY